MHFLLWRNNENKTLIFFIKKIFFIYRNILILIVFILERTILIDRINKFYIYDTKNTENCSTSNLENRIFFFLFFLNVWRKFREIILDKHKQMIDNI